MIVIDASAAIELLLRTELGERVELRALDPDERLHAPHLLDLEVAQVLRRLTHLKEITAARAHEAISDYAGLLVERSAHSDLLRRVWELRDSMTAYDGGLRCVGGGVGCAASDLRRETRRFARTPRDD